MVREINHDTFFLGQKSEPTTEADKGVAQDLLDGVRKTTRYKEIEVVYQDIWISRSTGRAFLALWLR